MRSKLWTFVREHLVGDVPDEMSACLQCSAVQCRQDKYETCPNRLRHVEALRAMKASASGVGQKDPA
jgi:hypothetical protein